MSGNNATAWNAGVRLKPDAIKGWRLEKQWSQQRAAKACKMSEVTWRRCETGKFIQPLTAARLAKALRLKLSELLVK